MGAVVFKPLHTETQQHAPENQVATPVAIARIDNPLPVAQVDPHVKSAAELMQLLDNYTDELAVAYRYQFIQIPREQQQGNEPMLASLQELLDQTKTRIVSVRKNMITCCKASLEFDPTLAASVFMEKFTVTAFNRCSRTQEPPLSDDDKLCELSIFSSLQTNEHAAWNTTSFSSLMLLDIPVAEEVST